MRIMIFTDDLTAGTGFSEEARNVMYRLAQMGHEIFWIGMRIGFPIDMPDSLFPDLPHKDSKIKVLGYVGPSEAYGALAVKRYYDIYNPDLIWLMGDPHHIAPYDRLKKSLKFPLLFYVTLDGLPIPPQWGEVMGIPNINVCMTEWALNQYALAGIPVHAYVHHGVNWNYWQVSEEKKLELRKKYGIPEDVTLFINWDNNQYRKRDDALLRCWKDFNPIAKKAKLLLFTDWFCRIGFNLEEKIVQYGVPRETIISPEQLIGREKLWEISEEPWLVRDVAAMGDIYLSTSGGEGFGKCNLEAMTLGQTVIATDCSAITEVLDKYGVLVPSYEGRAGRYQLHDMARSSELAVVNEEKFVEKMTYYYQNIDERIRLGQKAREWAKEFDYDSKIMKGWKQILGSFNPDMLMAQQFLQS